jgi:hypothetical protein
MVQKEQTNFLLSIEIKKKRELEISFDKRCEEIENYLRDKETTFELEKRSELQRIASLREKAGKKIVASCSRKEKP